MTAVLDTADVLTDAADVDPTAAAPAAPRNPGGTDHAPAHSMVLAAALAVSAVSTLGMSSLPDQRTVDRLTRTDRARYSAWDVVMRWRAQVDPRDVRSRWFAAVAAVTRLYPELVDVDLEGPLPDIDTAADGDLFVPPRLRTDT